MRKFFHFANLCLPLLIFLAINLYPQNIEVLRQRVPQYISELKKLIEEINKGEVSFDKMVKAASLASTIVLVAKDKKLKMKAARIGLEIAKGIMKKYPDRAAGYYYGALHLGYYALYRGPQYSLADIPLVKRWLEKAMKINPDYHSGSLYILACALYFEAPGFPVSIGNIFKAKKYCEMSVKKFPQNATAYLYLAAIYSILGNNKKAEEVLLQCKRNARPIDNSLEEKVFTEEDLKTADLMLEKLKRGEKLGEFMKER